MSQLHRIKLLLARKRVAMLSITHKFRAHLEAEFDISESSHTAPHHHVAGRTVTGARKITAELSELRHAITQGDRACL